MSLVRLQRLAAAVTSGAVVACPAESVWGLSCDPFNGAAVLELLRLKSRKPSKGLIVTAGDIETVEPLLTVLSEAERAAVRLSWPGANTWLLPNQGVFPEWITGASEEVAIRVTSSPTLAALCRLSGGFLVSTSANPAGAQPAMTRFQVINYFGPDLPVAAGSVDLSGKPSTIRRVGTGDVIRA